MKKYRVRPYSVLFNLQIVGMVAMIIGAGVLTVAIVEVFAG